MLGNLWEWTADCYSDTFANHPEDAAPLASGRCKGRVMRGGSFESDARRVRVASRSARDPEAIAPDFGFRVVREIREAPSPAAPPVTATAPPSSVPARAFEPPQGGTSAEPTPAAQPALSPPPPPPPPPPAAKADALPPLPELPALPPLEE